MQEFLMGAIYLGVSNAEGKSVPILIIQYQMQGIDFRGP